MKGPRLLMSKDTSGVKKKGVTRQSRGAMSTEIQVQEVDKCSNCKA